MKVVLGLLILICSVPSYSAVTCKDYFTVRPNIQQREDYFPGWNAGLVVQRFVAHLQAWNHVLGPLAVAEIKFELLEGPVEKSSFTGHAQDNHLRLGMLIGDRSPVIRDVVLAHEFGHAVFWNHFKLRIHGAVTTLKEFSALIAAYRIQRGPEPELDKLREDIQKTVNALDVIGRVGTFEDVRELREILDQQRKELAEKDPHGEAFKTLYFETLNYNELFADMLPALLWNEPRVFSELVHGEGIDPKKRIQIRTSHRSENKVDADPREFALVPFKGWKREASDHYTSLDPVRGYLWKMYMEKIAADDIPLFLITYLNAVSFHMQERLARLGDSPVTVENLEMKPDEMNREFLRIFVREARHVGLPMIHRD